MKILIIKPHSNDIERLHALAPEVEFVGAESNQDAIKLIIDADAVYVGAKLEGEILLASSDKLRWVQTRATGVDSTLTPELISSNIILTNAKGALSKPISEHAFSMITCFSRGLNMFIRQQIEGVWQKAPVTQLTGATILIIGLGNVGSSIAQRAHGFEMKIMAIDLREVEKSHFIERVGKPNDLHSLLPMADFVVISCPLTKLTHHMMGTSEFALMKSSSFIINIARGNIIDEAALIKALQKEQIAGAGLDVFTQEPLPADSPLWKMSNVIITTHTAGTHPQSAERSFQIFCQNLKRFLAGEPLTNIVDKQAGF